MLFYYQSWMFYNHFIVILYHFLVLTYWHSAKCQLQFFPCFLHCRKSISNGVQMPGNSTMIFYGPHGRQWALVAPGGCPEGGTTYEGAPGGPGAPWWVVPSSGLPQVQLGPVVFLLAHKTSSKIGVAFGLHLILISCDVKNMQKTTTGTWHYVDRLVPKNDIKWL